jgi:hypothetical protein
MSSFLADSFIKNNSCAPLIKAPVTNQFDSGQKRQKTTGQQLLLPSRLILAGI